MTYFQWTGVPDPAWVRDLRSLSPPHTRLSHLVLRWEPGFPWAPVQRWILDQRQPLDGMDAWAAREWGEVMDLEAPCQCAFDWSSARPPSQATSIESIRCPRCRRVASAGRTAIMAAWRDGYHTQPFWILQGEHGGHKLTFSAEEQEIAGHAPAAPGALPYAGYDQRVRRRLQAYDLTQRATRTLRHARKEDRDTLRRQVRSLSEAYLTNVVEEARDEMGNAVLAETPRVHGYRGIDDHEVSARYIETGRLSP